MQTENFTDQSTLNCPHKSLSSLTQEDEISIPSSTTSQPQSQDTDVDSCSKEANDTNDFFTSHE